MHRATPPPPPQAYPPLAHFADLALRDRTRPAAAAHPACAAAPLLTHHQIVELAAPFARRGHALDLAASDRLRRKLVFRSIQHGSARGAVAPTDAGDVSRPPAMLETLQLDSPRQGYFRLTRSLCDDDGLRATLEAEGTRPSDLLERVQAVSPQRHFHTGAGYRMVSSGCIAAADSTHAGFRMTHAVVQTAALTLDLHVSDSRSANYNSGDVMIQPCRSGDALPADLLAVLGWDWSLLQASGQGWQGSVRLRGGPGSLGDAEHKLRTAAAHLVRTFAESPQRFHERLRAARWRVLARHAIPLLVFAMLGFGVLFAEAFRAARGSPMTLVLMGIPPALLLLFILRSERPRLAMPTWPRRLTAQTWGAAR